MEIRLPSLGHAGTGEHARNGDLYVTLKIKEDPVFKILDDDIYVDLDVNLGIFFLGGEVEVALPEGGAIKIKVEPGSKVGGNKIIKGRGLWKSKGGSRGDLIVKLALKLKDVAKMTNKEIQLIKELAELGV